MKGVGKLRRPDQLVVGRELWLARDRMARERDISPVSVLPHDVLASIAEKLPRTEAELTAARQEAAGIREKAREDGARIVEEARSRADAESERILGAGRQQLSAERQSASAQLRGEVGTLASDLASKIVGESLTDDERSRRVIDRFLDDLESSQTATR